MGQLQVLLYSVAILTSLACAVCLFIGYARRRLRLLLWSALCFAGLTVSNLLLFADLVVFPNNDLRLARLIASLIGMVFLLYAFIWDSE